MGSVGAMARGSADRYFQQDIKDTLAGAAEGIEGQVPYKGAAATVLHQLAGGLRAAMGYVGARTLQELHEKAEFLRISGAGLRESHVHDVTITRRARTIPREGDEATRCARASQSRPRTIHPPCELSPQASPLSERDNADFSHRRDRRDRRDRAQSIAAADRRAQRDRCRAPPIARRACPRRCDPDRGRSVRRRRRPQNGGRARRRRQSRHPYARGLSRFPAGRLGRERPHPPLRVGKSGGRGDGTEHAVHPGSFAPVYPDRGDQWIDERTPIAPVRYNRTVADAERSAERPRSGGAGVVLRFAMFYGPSWFTAT